MLQRVQPEIDEVGRLGVAVDAHDAALLAEPVSSERLASPVKPPSLRSSQGLPPSIAASVTPPCGAGARCPSREAPRLDVDQTADAKTPAAHLAEHGARHLGVARQVPQPVECLRRTESTMRDWLSPNSHASGRMSACELELGAERLAGTGDAALGQRHGQAALGEVVRRAHEPFADGLQADLLHLHLDRQVDPRRRAAHHAVHRGKVLAAAQLLARAAEQHDDVAFGLEPLRRVVADVGEQADHGDRRRRRNRAAVGLVVEADVAADDRHAERLAGVANARAPPRGTAT